MRPAQFQHFTFLNSEVSSRLVSSWVIVCPLCGLIGTTAPASRGYGIIVRKDSMREQATSLMDSECPFRTAAAPSRNDFTYLVTTSRVKREACQSMFGFEDETLPSWHSTIPMFHGKVPVDCRAGGYKRLRIFSPRTVPKVPGGQMKIRKETLCFLTNYDIIYYNARWSKLQLGDRSDDLNNQWGERKKKPVKGLTTGKTGGAI